MFLNNNNNFKLKQNFLVRKNYISQHLLVKTALKAGAFSCECGCKQSKENTKDIVATNTTTTNLV